MLFGLSNDFAYEVRLNPDYVLLNRGCPIILRYRIFNSKQKPIKGDNQIWTIFEWIICSTSQVFIPDFQWASYCLIYGFLCSVLQIIVCPFVLFLLGHCIVCIFIPFLLGHCIVCIFLLGHCIVCTFLLGHYIVCTFLLGHYIVCAFLLGHCIVCTFLLGHCIVCAFLLGLYIVCTFLLGHYIVCTFLLGHYIVCTFLLGHCIVCTFFIYQLYFPLWYLQNFLSTNENFDFEHYIIVDVSIYISPLPKRHYHPFL